MSFSDTPPPHVSQYYYLIGGLLLSSGGILYTQAYHLMTRQSLRDRTYAMPLFALAFNFAWETVFLFYVTDEFEVKLVLSAWILMDLGLVYSVVKYGHNEWAHAPIVGKHIGKIFAVMLAWWCWALWAVAHWWIEWEVNPKLGKWYMGVEGPDTSELAYWTALVAQVVLSWTSLAQILVRGNTGGASYRIWACRFFGSLLGLNGNYLWTWWAWPEGHEYFANPVSVCLLTTWVVADIAYFFVFRSVKKKEIVLDDGRKVRSYAKVVMNTP